MIKSISIVGSGNIASHLGRAFTNKNIEVVDVFSRNSKTSKLLCNDLGVTWRSNLKDISINSDLILIAVNDNNIENVLTGLVGREQLVVHTAGSVDIKIFKDYEIKQCGVFYPLQSLTKGMVSPLEDVTFCIDASNVSVQNRLVDLAKILSTKVILTDFEDRKTLHLAAVFANNFPNHLLSIAESILEERDLSIDLLRPLIKNMLDKVDTMSAKALQTGPASRNDTKTLNTHIKSLDNPYHKEIYKVLSESIISSQSD